MKTILTFVAILPFMCSSVWLRGQSQDPVKKATQANEKKSDAKIIDEDAAEFLVKSTDARMMDLKEGEMAAKKGTTPAVRQYGRLMVKDQTILLKKIRQLAVSRQISLPAGISNKKEDGRGDLAEKTGKDFDEKFIKMMQLDHERDVKLFKKATGLKDKGISQFAGKYLPMIETHLDKIKDLKASH